ncbi:MAG: hypothetical protein IJX53_08865 [Clostridia bacterium]|nr:hypothetical protein [Clostridia bacterium]
MEQKPFFLFGMGNRPKLIYMDGVVFAYPSYQALYRFDCLSETILPAEYTVQLETTGGPVRLWEDEQGVWLSMQGKTLCLGEGMLHLPSFAHHPNRDTLRILHHEILVNIIEGQPVPNYFVYPKAWYRDGAMMAMVLEQTGNLHLIRDWAAGLTALYDRNNKGNEESDNLGQLLYILAKTGLCDHPLVDAAIKEANRRLEDGVLTGSTDYAPHPVYQTKWLKLGLDALGLDSSHLRIPEVKDSYAAIFWMDGHTMPPADDAYNTKYPYLWWAKKHTMRQAVDPALLAPTYPISSETRASEAEYENLRRLFPGYADGRHAAPHTWHAAEMFLYLTDMYGKGEE